MYAVLIGLSRVVVGAHYATDVIGGLVLGVVIAVAITALVRAIPSLHLQTVARTSTPSTLSSRPGKRASRSSRRSV